MRESNIPPSRLPAVCECGAHGFALLTRGFVTFFSPDKLPLVAGRKWAMSRLGRPTSKRPYATRGEDGRQIMMHRVLIGAEGSAMVDHRNGDGLSNEDENLRLCTRFENNQNARPHRDKAVPFKGVSPVKDRFGVWICIDRKARRVGTFACPIEAARAYDAAALEHYGSFALTNAMLGLIPPAA